jgi:phosphate transport system substrate-binding protein
MFDHVGKALKQAPATVEMGANMKRVLHNVLLWSGVLMWWSVLFVGELHAQPPVRVGGTGAGTVLLGRVLEDYRRAHPGASFQLMTPPMGSAGSLRALAGGALELAVVSFPPGQQVPGVATWTSKVVPWVTTPLVFTGRDLPVGAHMTLHQVADVYAGRVTRWPDGRQVRLITRTELETDTKLLRALSPLMDNAIGTALQRLGQPVAENDIDNQRMLERTPGSFGSIALGQIRLTQSTLAPVVLDGAEPTTGHLKSGRYTLSKALYLVIPKEAKPEVLDLVKYLQSSVVLEELERNGFVGLPR